VTNTALPLTRVGVPVGTSFTIWAGTNAGSGVIDCTAMAWLRHVP
jgi:hypothetical protein